MTGTLAEALEERDRLKEEAEEGVLGRSDEATQRPLRDWLPIYLQYREERDRVAAGTLQTQQYVLEANVIPDVGDWIPDAVELKHVDALVGTWLNAKKDDGTLYSATTIKNRVGYLKRFLRWTLKQVGKNTGWLRDVDTVRHDRCSKRGRALTPAQAKAFLAEMKTTYPQHYGICFLLLATGQRFGSISALRWEDVDREGGWLVFARSHYRGDVKQGNKTGKVVRVPVTPQLLEVIDWQRRRMVKKQHPGLSTGLVFPAETPPSESATDGHRVASDMRRPFAKVCKTIGIARITPHDLRRTFNSWSAERASGTVVRSITGHSSAKMTDHYFFGSKDAKKAVIDGVVELID